MNIEYLPDAMLIINLVAAWMSDKATTVVDICCSWRFCVERKESTKLATAAYIVWVLSSVSIIINLKSSLMRLFIVQANIFIATNHACDTEYSETTTTTTTTSYDMHRWGLRQICMDQQTSKYYLAMVQHCIMYHHSNRSSSSNSDNNEWGRGRGGGA